MSCQRTRRRPPGATWLAAGAARYGLGATRGWGHSARPQPGASGTPGEDNSNPKREDSSNSKSEESSNSKSLALPPVPSPCGA
jgi:hypothetical protein